MNQYSGKKQAWWLFLNKEKKEHLAGGVMINDWA